ncbi:hypothetical protein HNR31_002976 [Anoxybacillus caldiproteolyticus]|uniref:Uncharacterized protein n=1 Tax=Thermaerobacillus caldiproteolyticus TaxID=247480 RepID=A0A7V9Z912_9BACL|nr:hypothetical protein [Anoxybacillus caldiproteolyticus]
MEEDDSLFQIICSNEARSLSAAKRISVGTDYGKLQVLQDEDKKQAGPLYTKGSRLFCVQNVSKRTICSNWYGDSICYSIGFYS